MLASLGALEPDDRVLDLYAGSGSFGIESLSRGAAFATFVEQDRAAAAVLEANLTQLGFDDRAEVVVAPVERVVASLAGPFAVAFCDPPYAIDPWADLLPVVTARHVVGHADHEVPLPTGWEALRRKNYGRSHVVIARRSAPASSGAPHVP